MLSHTEITEIECIFLLIDNGFVSRDVASQFLEWLLNTSIERFALLHWMLTRWVYIRKNAYDLPKRRQDLPEQVQHEVRSVAATNTAQGCVVYWTCVKCYKSDCIVNFCSNCGWCRRKPMYQ